MHTSVDKSYLEIDALVARKYTALSSLLDAFPSRVGIFLVYGAADNLVFHLQTARGVRLHIDDDTTELTVTARLTYELALDVADGLCDSLAVADLRRAHVKLNLELSEHSVNHNIEV